MTTIRITKGVNMRLPGNLIGTEQAMLLQNYDMTEEERLYQIPGSVKYHGENLGTNAPDWIGVNYNENEDKQDVLTAVDNKILKKNFGANEFTELYSGFIPGSIKTSITLDNKSYVPSFMDGLFEYDGISKFAKINDVKLRDLIISKELNRCFGIDSDFNIVYTDDLAGMGGVPLTWAALNVITLPPTEGDVAEKLWILDGRLVALKTSSIWIYYILGGPTDWRPQKISFSGGCIAPWTVRQVGGELWFLGYSAATGRGLYAFNGSTVRLLSYDVGPFLDRINPAKIKDACAEFVDNQYKLSFSIDSSVENNFTFHVDTIRINKDNGLPLFYGPHTYGFSCSAILNTRKFKGEHLFGRKHSDGARIFKVADYMTQYSSEMVDDGDLIPTVILTGVIDSEPYKGGLIDTTWFKKYQHFFFQAPPRGTWLGQVEILKGYENETFMTVDQYMEDENYSLGAVSLDSDPLDFKSSFTGLQPMDITADAIQFKISNFNVKTRMAFESLSYDAVPDRRKKYVSLLQI